MKKRKGLLSGIGIFVFQWVIIISSCYAQTPEESFQGLAKVVKSSKSIEKVLGSVDWRGILNKMSPEERAALKVTEETTLRSYYAAKVVDSGKKRVEKVSSDMKAEDKRDGA